MRSLLFDDRMVWVVSIILAVFLWVQVSAGAQREVQRTFPDIPVQWRDVPEGLAVLDVSPSRVEVTIRGERDLMQQVSREDFTATVNLVEVEPGMVDVFVSISVPRGIQLVQVAPQTVTVAVEESAEAVHPVRVEKVGTPDTALTTLAVTPAQVIVNGPASRVEEVAEVVAEVDVAGLQEGLTEQIVCRALDEDGDEVRGVLVVPRQVEVSIMREAARLEREIPIRPISAGTPPGDLAVISIQLDPSSVSVSGPGSVVEEIEVLNTTVLDLTEILQGAEDEMEPGEVRVYTYQAQPEFARDVDPGHLNVEPDEVMVEVTVLRLE